MKTNLKTFGKIHSGPLLAAGILGLALASAGAGESAGNRPVIVTAVAAEVGGSEGAKEGAMRKQTILLRALEPVSVSESSARRDLPWLGVATEEASEVLTAQLGLEAGVGLVVTYVTPDSPAAKAGLEKNDVLIEFEGHALVHPAQLRKLVQVRKEGDSVQLTYCRAGQKESVSATLAKGAGRFGLLGDDESWSGDLHELQSKLRDLQVGEAIRGQMEDLRESLGRLQLDREEVQKEVRRGMEQARQAVREVLRHTTNAHKALGPAAQVLEDLAHGDVQVSKNATVTVKRSDTTVKTTVKADDTGVYVLVAAPRRHLTVHDKEGKLLFDGEIETPEQQAKVPADVWQKVEPMLDELGTAQEKHPEVDEKSEPGTL